MRFSLVAIATTLISAVMAQKAYPTVPVAETVWTAGQAVTIQWKLSTAGDKTAYSVDLFNGDPAKQTLVQSFGNAAAGATSLKVTLPATLTGDWYSVRIGATDYSHYFMIKSSTGATPKGPMPTPVSANSTATSAAPSATATTAGNSTASATATVSATKTATPTNSGANLLTVGPMAVAAAVIAAALSL